MMAFATMLGVVMFGILFNLTLKDSHELIWDRALIVLFGLIIYLYGYRSGMKTSSYSRLVYILIFITTTYVQFTVYQNDFNGFYFLSLFITTQVYSYTFRDVRGTFWYIVYSAVLILGALYFNTSLEIGTVLFYVMVTICISILQFLAARAKCRFLTDMRMNQELLRTLISRSENAVFLTDMRGNIFDVNTRVSELFGYSNSELLDRDFKMLRKHSLEPTQIEAGLLDIENSGIWTTETVLVRKNGLELPVRLSITLINNRSNNYLVYRVLDITSIKENEAKIIEARDKAEQAVKVKGQFLAVMSHEIRTPLNGVIATTSLLQQTALNAEQEEYAGTIHKSGQSLLMLINDILEFSKMESGKMELDLQPCKIDEAMNDVTDLLRSHAELKNIELEVNLGNNIPQFLKLDGHRLKQILFNLVGNAIKFTERGKVVVSCDLEQTIHNRVKLCIKVRDTGIGIPSEKIHLLFQSFSQVDSSTSRKFGGTGLGLAISKQLCELMGGTIQVESTNGIGTTFTLYICGEVAHEFELEETASSQVDYLTVDFKNLKVLVAEDNEINRQVLRYIMDSFGVQCDYVADGLEAFKACAAKDYDVVFMDMQMPLMDGIESTVKIRSQLTHQPAIIAITANTFDDDRKLCMEAGMNDFLGKPFEAHQLKTVISKWCQPNIEVVNSAA